MAQITLRGLDSELEKEVRKRARESGKSLNRVILDILQQAPGLGKGKKRAPADSLKQFAGGWSEEEASRFLDSIKSCEQLDEEMWQ
jgi:plasmid stability protein